MEESINEQKTSEDRTSPNATTDTIKVTNNTANYLSFDCQANEISPPQNYEVLEKLEQEYSNSQMYQSNYNFCDMLGNNEEMEKYLISNQDNTTNLFNFEDYFTV